jgi:hypothetical protein
VGLYQREPKLARWGSLINVIGGRERTLLRYLDRLGEVAMSQTTRIYIIPNISDIETIDDPRGTRKGPLWAKSSWLISMLRTQSSAQIRAATTRIQRQKRIRVGLIVVCGYIGNCDGSDRHGLFPLTLAWACRRTTTSAARATIPVYTRAVSLTLLFSFSPELNILRSIGIYPEIQIVPFIKWRLDTVTALPSQ